MGAILESEKKQEVKTSSEKVQISSFTGDYEYFIKGYLFRLLTLFQLQSEYKNKLIG